jgi:hypothetical protein
MNQKINNFIILIKNIFNFIKISFENDNLIEIEYNCDDFKHAQLFIELNRLEMLKEVNKIKYNKNKIKQIKFIVIIKTKKT